MTEGSKPKRSRAASPNVLALPAQLDIAAVGELKPRLDAALAAGASLTLDAGAVAHVDAAGLQLLVAFQRARSSSGGAHAGWRKPSDALREAAALLGLDEALCLDASLAT